MRKKLALFVAAVGMIVAGVVAFLAFESYTLDINAHLEPVLAVNPHGDWDLGTVYPEQDRFTKLFVGLSNSAKADPNFIAVDYNFSCQSKPLDPLGNAVLNGENTPARIVRNLCPHISVDDQQGTAIFGCPQPFTHEHADGTIESHPTPDPCKYVTRTLDLSGQPHGYGINIEFPDCEGAHQKEPGAKEIDCGFDPATGKFAGVDLAAQISVQVLDIDQAEKCIVRKDGTQLETCVKLSNTDQVVDCDGIASNKAGCDAATQEVQKDDVLHAWPAPGAFGKEGIDIFDRDDSGGWSKVDDIHLEDPSGSCTTGDRSGSLPPGDPPTHNAGDCLVLDLNKDLPVGEVVDCDLETGSFCTGTLVSDLRFFDTDGDGLWNNGEDIVWDRNGNGIYD